MIVRVAWLVDHHHTYTDIDDVDHQILVEADFLVNLFENNHPDETQIKVYQYIFNTESRKELFQTMFTRE